MDSILYLAVSVVITLSYFFLYVRHQKDLQQLNGEIVRLRNEIPTLDRQKLKSLNGIFEVHITVNPEDNYVSLLQYSMNQSRKMKLVFACSVAKNNQYMLSYFTRKTDDKLAVDGALQVESEIQSLGVKVVRVKVESHGAEGTPITTKDYEDSCEALKAKYVDKVVIWYEPYFEFHCKIDSTDESIDTMENDVSKYEGAALSYNLCSQSKKPLLTIRVYDGFSNAQSYKDKVMNGLKEKGYVFEDKIQQEYSVFDSHSALDSDWIVGLDRKNKRSEI